MSDNSSDKPTGKHTPPKKNAPRGQACSGAAHGKEAASSCCRDPALVCYGAGLPVGDVLVEGLRVEEHNLQGRHGAGAKAVDVLVEGLWYSMVTVATGDGRCASETGAFGLSDYLLWSWEQAYLSGSLSQRKLAG